MNEAIYKEAMKRKPDTKMEMLLITPELATAMLRQNDHNRKKKDQAISLYAAQMRNGDWDEWTGTAISIGSDGQVCDGQNRLEAIVKANMPVWMWVCTNCRPRGYYDDAVRRKLADQIKIARPELDAIYSNSRVSAMIAALINCGKTVWNHTLSSCAQAQTKYIDLHIDRLSAFFKVFHDTYKTPKIRTANMFLACYLAFLGGEDPEKLFNFYTVACTGMSTDPTHFPIIALRNYLLADAQDTRIRIGTIARIQWALKKYLNKTCVKQTREPDKLIWPFPEDPWKKDGGEGE